MQVLVELRPGLADPVETVKRILAQAVAPMVRVVPAFDAADPDLARFVHVRIDVASSRSPAAVISILHAAPEVISATVEPPAEVGLPRTD